MIVAAIVQKASFLLMLLDFVTALSGTKGLGLTVCPNGQQRSGPQVSRSRSADRTFGFTENVGDLQEMGLSVDHISFRSALCTYYHS